RAFGRVFLFFCAFSVSFVISGGHVRYHAPSFHFEFPQNDIQMAAKISCIHESLSSLKAEWDTGSHFAPKRE
ncbi:MAG: hypothetical protein J6S69_03340, partial [Proteobacteria bacterium]|nr:hypothetical protein [Pseudomonadota bacterium]